MSAPGSKRGFTLVELLIVMAIIAILTGLAFPAMSAVRRRSQMKTQKALFDKLRLNIETYANDFGDYPPSSFKGIKLKGSNGQNEGGEVLARCLTTSARSGPYAEFSDEQLGNLDGDSISASKANPTRSVWSTPELHELLDVWGNPIAYMHNSEYDKGSLVTLPSGETRKPAQVTANKSEKTGQYSGLTSFQLWSAGPDGEAGTEDDVRAWGE